MRSGDGPACRTGEANSKLAAKQPLQGRSSHAQRNCFNHGGGHIATKVTINLVHALIYATATVPLYGRPTPETRNRGAGGR